MLPVGRARSGAVPQQSEGSQGTGTRAELPIDAAPGRGRRRRQVFFIGELAVYFPVRRPDCEGGFGGEL